MNTSWLGVAVYTVRLEGAPRYLGFFNSNSRGGAGEGGSLVFKKRDCCLFSRSLTRYTALGVYLRAGVHYREGRSHDRANVSRDASLFSRMRWFTAWETDSDNPRKFDEFL